MQRVKEKWGIIWVLVAFIFIVPGWTASADVTQSAANIPADKDWKITFSLPIIASSVTEETIYVVDGKNEKQKVTFTVNGKAVTVHAPEAGYAAGDTYTLHVTTNVLAEGKKETKALKQAIAKSFTISENHRYQVVNVLNNGSTEIVADFPTFDEAAAKLRTNQAIMADGRFVKISEGLVATNPKTVSSLYTKPTFTAGFEYAGIMADNELKYIDATEEYVQVEAAGQSLYMKPADATLIPIAAAKGRSYYKVNEQGLWHYIYRHHAGKYDGAMLIGKKPDFLQPGVSYYSTDGANFADANGKAVGQAYGYFQYASLRVPTSYSAEEIDAYIDAQLLERQNMGHAKYKDATTKSPLKGMGTLLKQVEQQHRLNALFLLAFAMHESDYGMSCHALNNNNLFGLNIPDSADQCKVSGNKGEAKYFPTIEANLAGLIERLNVSYLDPGNMKDFRYNGVALGNKMIGMNVRYASDPYWGEKIGGHMYRTDVALGSKDYQAYQIGFTALAEVSVRTSPVIADNRAYQYKLAGSIKRFDHMPLTLSNEASSTKGWYRVISELPAVATDLYTVTDNVRLVKTY